MVLVPHSLYFAKLSQALLTFIPARRYHPHPPEAGCPRPFRYRGLGGPEF
jgi:hypothetical protein